MSAYHSHAAQHAVGSSSDINISHEENHDLPRRRYTSCSLTV